METGQIVRVAMSLFVLLGSPGAVSSAPDAAVAPHPLPAPSSESWRPLTFPKISRHTAYNPAAVISNERPVLEARANCSASGLILAIPDSFDLTRTPRLRWRWRVEQGLNHADERSKSGDDFAARVYVLFEFNPTTAGAWERLQRRIGTALYGEGMPGKAISYVWASRAERGEVWTNPYSADTQMVVLETGSRGEWHTETVDLLADRVRLLGLQLDPVMAIALMTDSDNTCVEVTAYYSDFQLLPPETNSDPAP